MSTIEKNKKVTGFALQKQQRLSFAQFYTKCILIGKLCLPFQLLVKNRIFFFFFKALMISGFILITEKKDTFSIYRITSSYIDSVYII